MHHGRLVVFVECFKTFRESVRVAVGIPVKAVGIDQALGIIETERMDIRQEHQQRSQTLVLGADIKRMRRLNCVDHLLTTIRKADHLCLGALGLRQERGEIAGIQRVTN